MAVKLTCKMDALYMIMGVLSTKEETKTQMKIKLDLIREILEEAEKVKYENYYEKYHYEKILKMEKGGQK